MDDTSKATKANGHGLSGLFDDSERRDLFKKYLLFLVWLEVLIFVGCWFYQLGTDGYDRFGPVDIPFPWKTYFLIAFLAPVAVTFLLGTIIVGFNKYLGSASPREDAGGQRQEPASYDERTGKIYRLAALVQWVQRLPYLGLLLLLAGTIGLIYNLDVVIGLIGTVGETSIRVFLLSAAVILGLASFFALVFLVLNYKLKKRSMEYRYKSHVAERYGLVILDDNTVINSDGKLLIRGRKWKDAVPLITADSGKNPPPHPRGEQPSQASDINT
jgi:hypothetical protein